MLPKQVTTKQKGFIERVEGNKRQTGFFVEVVNVKSHTSLQLVNRHTIGKNFIYDMDI